MNMYRGVMDGGWEMGMGGKEGRKRLLLPVLDGGIVERRRTNCDCCVIIKKLRKEKGDRLIRPTMIIVRKTSLTVNVCVNGCELFLCYQLYSYIN